MKNVLKLIWIMALSSQVIMAQDELAYDVQVIKNDSLEIAYSKTSSIVFPFAIVSVDMGSQDVLAQKAKGVENILQVKAARPGFEESSLTVITSDGILYPFIVCYNEQPAILNLSAHSLASPTTLFKPGTRNEKDLQSYSKLALQEEHHFRGLDQNKYGIRLQVNGISIQQDLMYFRVVVTNHSRISYDLDQLRFFIRDKKKVQRTASQEIEIVPVYNYRKGNQIADKSSITMVFALPKFTIPEKKFLAVQLTESKGSRQLEVKVNNRKLEKLRLLPAL